MENITCDAVKDYSNLTHQEITQTVFYSREASFIIKVILPIIFIIGILGNMAFFLLLVRVQSMRTITNFYLANLAAADLMILIIETMFQAWCYRSSIVSWNYPFHTSFGCSLFFFGYYVFYSASNFLIAKVSIDRYMAICQPLKYRNLKLKKQKTYITAGLIWILSILFGALNVPSFARLVDVCIEWPTNKRYKHFPSVARRCDPIYPLMETISGFVSFVPFFIALIITVYNNIRIVQRFKQPAPGNNEDQARRKIKRRVTWMLIANSTIFFCFLAPSIFLEGFSRISDALSGNVILIRISFILAMVNSAINPILYGVVSPSYRRGFLKAFGLARGQIEPSEIRQPRN